MDNSFTQGPLENEARRQPDDPEDVNMGFNMDVQKRFKRVDAKRVRAFIIEFVNCQLDSGKEFVTSGSLYKGIVKEIAGVTENTVFVALLQEANKNYWFIDEDEVTKELRVQKFDLVHNNNAR